MMALVDSITSVIIDIGRFAIRNPKFSSILLYLMRRCRLPAMVTPHKRVDVVIRLSRVTVDPVEVIAQGGVLARQREPKVAITPASLRIRLNGLEVILLSCITVACIFSRQNFVQSFFISFCVGPLPFVLKVL